MNEIRIPRGDELSPELIEQLKDDLANHPQRKLTSTERDIYARAIIKAVSMVGAFRDALALLRPFMDATASTAYTDPYARVGLGYWFFHLLNKDQQATVLLHECMHVLNNHFVRSADLASMKNQQLFNMAGDFEINTVLSTVVFVDLSEGILPDRKPYNYPPFKTMEQYAELLQKDQEDREDNCQACKDEEAGKKPNSKQDQSSKKDGQDKKADDQEQSDGQAEEAGGNDGSHDEGDTEDADGGEGDGGDTGSGADKPGGSQPGGTQPGNAPGQGHTCGKGDGDGEGEGEGSGNGQGQGSGQASGSGQGGSAEGNPVKGTDGGWGCEASTEDKEAAADAAGIQRASDVEQTLAKQNTAARIVEEKNQAGRSASGAGDQFWDSLLRHLTPPKVDWRKVFRRIVASSVDAIVRGRSDYTFRRVSRRLQSKDFVFPGMVNYQPKIMLGMDTSGSMGNEDYQKALTEIEGILKEVARGKGAVSMFSVDTQVGNISPVTSVKKVRFTGGGGTVMAVAWQYVNSLPKAQKPDIFVLSTDGYIDWDDVETEIRAAPYKSVICVTQKGGFQSAPDSLKRIAPVLDISSDS